MQAKRAPSLRASVDSASSSSRDNDDAIQACYELLCSGRPLSEILAALKQHASLIKPNIVGEVTAGQRCSVTVDPHNDPPRLIIAPFVQPVTSMTEKEWSVSSKTAGDEAHEPGALNLRQNPAMASLARFLKVTGVGLLWLIPAVSLTILATASKSLMDAGITAKAIEAVAQAIPEPAQPSEFRESAEARTAEARLAPPATPERQRVEAQLTSAEVKAMLDRGDALVSMADIASARLFYERGAAAGNAQAALRLGATYDPVFLAQAGLRSVSGDAAAAHYWYERARDLGANDRDIPSPDQVIDSAQSSGASVADSSGARYAVATTGQAGTEPGKVTSPSGTEHDRTNQASVSRVQTASGSDRRSRPERQSNNTACPRSGRCLTPR